MAERVVVDTNVLFSALLSSSSGFGRHLIGSANRFLVCETVLVELFRHKERIVEASRLDEDDVVRYFHILLRRLELYKEELIDEPQRAHAMVLCAGIDEDDVPHVALTLHVGGLLWTGDDQLKRGLRSRGFDRFYEP